MTSHEEAIERDWKTAYVLGDLQEPERSRFEEHFFDCPTCSEGVRTAYLLLRGVEVTLKHPIFGAEISETPVVPIRKPARTVGPWVMRALPYAAIVVLLGGTATQYVALRKVRSPQVLAAFTIPAQAKGSTQKIVLPAGGGFVELDFDLLDAAAQYHWEIRSAGAGRALMSGPAQLPADAVVLKLLVPANLLQPGRYVAAISFPPD